MGVDLVVKGADFSANALGYDPPVTRGLRYWGFFGSAAADATAKAARLRKNWAPGGADGGVVGAPVIAAASTRFKSATNYVDTGLTESAACTMFAVLRSDATFADVATRPYFMGAPNLGFYIGSTTGAPQAGYAMASIYDNAGAQSIQLITGNLANAAAWTFVVMVRESGVGFRLLMPGLGVALTKADARALFASASTRKVAFGTGGRTDFLGESEMVMGGEYNVALTDAEIASVYAAAKAYCAGRGISI